MIDSSAQNLQRLTGLGLQLSSGYLVEEDDNFPKNLAELRACTPYEVAWICGFVGGCLLEKGVSMELFFRWAAEYLPPVDAPPKASQAPAELPR